ncbi:MAG: fatty acid desaturase [Pseudomonadota bacterium]
MHNFKIENLSDVQWKDLIRLSQSEIINELTLSLPWLLISWFAAFHNIYLVALACSFMFFLTGLRQVHNAYHYALGLSRPLTEWVMLIMSILMLGSMHAIQLNHLRHHQYCMQEEDIEAMSAYMPWWKAILIGPLFPICLHKKALNIGNAYQRKWIYAELAINFVWIVLVFRVLEYSWLKYHVLAMAVGQCLTAFFAVWTVHHDCQSEILMARTIRGKLKAFTTYNMFFHVEHHLFSAVPTCKLNLLAARIDSVAPDLVFKKVL